MTGPKTDIDLAICGHAWHGKSTLLGKAVAEMKMASFKQVEAARKAAREGRDPSFVFAQLVFRSKSPSHAGSEGAKGITILPSIVRFDLDNNRVTVIDTPGQEDYTNNRFWGMFQADLALLVVDASEGVKRVTEQVLRILRGFEIRLAGVAMTKMDRVDYSEEAYRERVDEVRFALQLHDIDPDPVIFFPTSAYEPGRDLFAQGEGVTGYDAIDWYDGPTFVEFMDGLSLATPGQEDPLRLAIHSSSVYDHVPGVGKAMTAQVAAGVLTPDVELHFEPLSAEHNEPVTARVRSIELTRGHIATPGVPIEEGVPRQLVGIALRSLSARETLRDLFSNRGVVAGSVEQPPSVARELLAELTVFEEGQKLSLGEQWTMHHHVDKVGVGVVDILAKRPVDVVEWEEGSYELLHPGEWGRVVLRPVRPIAIEPASVLPQLSKIVLREGTKAIAYGRCIEIRE